MLAGFNVQEEKKPAFHYRTNEGVLLKIYGLYGEAGGLESYTCRIQTPVCKSNQCEEVELDFYWDLFGNFTEFSLLPNKPLTKLDHVPFTRDDYDKLQIILLDQAPPFMHLKRRQLLAVDPAQEEPKVEAYSGATAKELKDSMVEGAVYTCFTLWHIANGDIQFQIQEHTRANLSEPLIRKLLQSEKIEAPYFLIDNLEPKYFEMFLKELTALANGSDGFLVNRFLQKIPSELLADLQIQDFIIRHYDQLDKPTEAALIEKFLDARTPITDGVFQILIRRIGQNDQAINNSIIKLACERVDAENIHLMERVFETVTEQEISISKENFELLASLSREYPSLKKWVRKLERGKKSKN